MFGSRVRGAYNQHCNSCYRLPDGDKDSDGPSESGDNTSESTQGASSEPAQEKGKI